MKLEDTKLMKKIDAIVEECGVCSQDFTQLVEKEVVEEAKKNDPKAYAEYIAAMRREDTNSQWYE